MRNVCSSLADGFSQDLDAIVRVVNGKVLLQTHKRGVFSQQSGAKSMERANPHGILAYQTLDPQPHFLGGFIGKGQGKYVLARYAVS